jgi:hypothetical protein
VVQCAAGYLTHSLRSITVAAVIAVMRGIVRYFLQRRSQLGVLGFKLVNLPR